MKPIEEMSIGELAAYVWSHLEKKQWMTAGKNKMPAWCYYENIKSNGLKYGKLYNWFAVAHKGGLAPKGWKIPDKDDWQKLSEHLGGEKTAGGKMKHAGTDEWNSPNEGATNESGFTALPGGFRVGSNLNFVYLVKWRTSGQLQNIMNKLQGPGT
jgi:uncharacterized protein (TIGR02145 family)